MKSVDLTVARNQLDSLLCSEEANPVGHRGVWFYAPENEYDTVEVGDYVRFCDPNDSTRPWAVGMVTELLNPADFPKYCSRINNRGFRWIDHVVAPSLTIR